jgi:hypothetical protein
MTKQSQVSAMAAYVPAYLHPGFMQSIPDNREGWHYVGTYNGGGALIWEKESRQVCVPSIWYNQPAIWRIEALRWYASRNDEAAEKLAAERFPKPWDHHTIETHYKSAERLRAQAAEIERTGIVTG